MKSEVMWFWRWGDRSACWWFVLLSTGVSHECRDILYQGSCVSTRPEGCGADGSFSTTSFRCRSSGEFVSEAQTVYPSCSQMLCSDTLIQTGVGMNSSCGGASIGDTCMVFCAEEYQAVSNDTSTCDVMASLRVDFSKCFSLTFNETCVVCCSVGYPGVDDKNTLYLQGLECTEESSELSTVRTLAERVLPCDDHFVQTQVQTTEACSLWQKGRVGPSPT